MFILLILKSYVLFSTPDSLIQQKEINNILLVFLRDIVSFSLLKSTVIN